MSCKMLFDVVELYLSSQQNTQLPKFKLLQRKQRAECRASHFKNLIVLESKCAGTRMKKLKQK